MRITVIRIACYLIAVLFLVLAGGSAYYAYGSPVNVWYAIRLLSINAAFAAVAWFAPAPQGRPITLTFVRTLAAVAAALFLIMAGGSATYADLPS